LRHGDPLKSIRRLVVYGRNVSHNARTVAVGPCFADHLDTVDRLDRLAMHVETAPLRLAYPEGDDLSHGHAG
jgi:hypothetical protein